MANSEVFGETAKIADQLIAQPQAAILQHTQTGSSPSTGDNRADTTHEIQAGTLPLLTIDRQEKAPANNHWWSGASAVGKDLVTGAYDEVTEHPLHVAASAVLGGVIGAGVMRAGPGAAIAASVAGIAFAGYELYEHAGNWLKDAKVVANSNDYPQAEVNKAHADLKDVGADGTLVAAGMTGSVLGGYASGAVAAAIDSATADTTASVVGASTNAVEGSEAATSGQPALSNTEWDWLSRNLKSEAKSFEPDLDRTYLTDLPNVHNIGPLPMRAAPVTDDYLSRAPLPQLRPASADGPLPAAPAPPASSEEGAFTPFTAGDTTFTQSADSHWVQRVGLWGDLKQGTDLFAFANRWATLMEQRMAGGETLTPGLVNATRAQAHADGLSGNAVYAAGKILVNDWKNGAQFAPFLDSPTMGL